MATLVVKRDESPENPRVDGCNGTTMACFHNRYQLGDYEVPFKSDDFSSWDEMRRHIEGKLDAICLPVYLYDHSGLSVRTTPFACRWDSGQVGYIYLERKQVRELWACKRITKSVLEKVHTLLIDDVKEYDAYLHGEVYCYELLDKDGGLIEGAYGIFGAEWAYTLGTEALDEYEYKKGLKGVLTC
jgi:hypothetical protein